MSSNTEHFTAGGYVDPRDHPAAAPGSDLKSATSETTVPLREMQRVDPITVKVEQAHRGISETVEYREITAVDEWQRIGQLVDVHEADYEWTTILSGTASFWLPGDIKRRPEVGGGMALPASENVILAGIGSVWVRTTGALVVLVLRRRFALPRG